MRLVLALVCSIVCSTAMRKTYSIYIYLRLSLLTVEANVVGQQVVISDACNIKQLCVVVILSHIFEALVEVIDQLIASIF